jgi:2-polyprenyl-3-methyl-5-hydroxy-6-metoxy-1,4-benzoquinol methylase
MKAAIKRLLRLLGMLPHDTAPSNKHRVRILTAGLDLKTARGLEIAPLTRVTVAKSGANITYLDRSTTEQLREIHKNDPNVPTQDIVHVDVATADRPLGEVLTEKFDYIIASHVIEHVPDLVAWFRELDAVLAPGGTIRLAIPDRRYTFDRIRRESGIAEVMLAHATSAKVPMAWCVLDNCYNARKVDFHAAWNGTIDDRKLQRHDENRTIALDLAARAARGEYVEVHVWVFTPKSLATLFYELAELDLMAFMCADLHDTERYTFEFFVTLKRGTKKEVMDSWRALT